ncbi:hypothetical protein BGX27_004892 [Mortierella sp. AM989]|nr:hypothetical protein BGX27_004892 [Mortierella sp. AM989]
MSLEPTASNGSESEISHGLDDVLPDNTFANGNNVTINAAIDASANKTTNNPTIAALGSSNTKAAATEGNSTPEKSVHETAPEKATSAKTQPILDISPNSDVDKSNASSRTDIEQLMARIFSKEERDLNLIGRLVGLALVLYCLPRLGWGTVIVGVLGMGFGGFMAAFYLLAVPEATRLQRARTIANFGKHPDQKLEIIDRVPAWSNTIAKDEDSIKEVHLPETKEIQHQRVCISPDIDPMVEEMITYTLRDFVNVPVGLVSEGQHNIPLRTSLVAMAMNVSNRLSNMRLPETALLGVFGLQNSFIVHLRAYRELRGSKLPIAEYVSTHANADSVLGRCYRKEERIKQFRSIAKAICQALLSKNDQQSTALFAVMQEIMATHVLEATLEHICDPDFVNLSIIDYFSIPTQNNKIGSEHPSIGVDASEPLTSKTDSPEVTPHEAPISALADSILMNAANLMDKSALDSQSSNQEVQTPVHPSTPQRNSMPLRVAAPGEINASSHAAAAEKPKPSAITLKLVLKNKNDYMDTFQAFMAYLRVWDASDLAQFWLMIDIFHRQIEQGTLTNIEDLRREATSIYETYCGPNPDHDVAGIKDARGGTLLKDLRKNMQREPATCFLESQAWALGVLETQYWTPFKIKQDSEKPVTKANENSLDRRSSSSNSINNTRLQDTLTNETDHSILSGNLSPSPTVVSTDPTIASYSEASGSSAPQLPPRLRARWIEVSDMVNQRPKTLISNSDLSYMIEVQIDEEHGWMVTRTFQQLEQLHAALVQQFPVVQRSAFPRWRLQTSDKVCNGLQSFLRAMLLVPEVGDSPSLTWFLSKEYDQNPGAVIPGASSSQSSNSVSILAFPPLSDSAFGVAAAQGAKTALRQASEASLSAGRFFKSLGSVVNPGSSPQLLADDRSVRGSFESERSIRSVSSALTLSDQRQFNGAPTTPGVTRYQEGDLDPCSTTPNLSNISQVNRRASSISGSSRGVDGSSLPLNPSPLQTQSLGQGSTSAQSTQQISGQMNAPHLNHSDDLPRQSLEPISAVPTRLETTPEVDPSTLSAPTGTPSTEPKKSQIPLLSTDELDLLIETTFTVLEDMMDFSKGQSIRRMTFGMLRELVRKSYRVAINQSFSDWVEQSTSHEKAVETVKWMKDDFFWPNGEWPVAPAAPAEPITGLPSPIGKKDVFQIGEEQYEVGADGLAVKISAKPSRSSSESDATSSSGGSRAAESTTGTRTLQEKEATREKARELFKMMLPGSLSTVLGKEAVLRGLVDVFEMFQIKELNMGLALSVLEMTVGLIFTR